MRFYEILRIVHSFRFGRACIVGLCCIIFGSFFGCRGSRSATAHSTIERNCTVRDTFQSESGAAAATASVLSGSRSVVSGHSCDSIEIQRDSSGLPSLIIWNHGFLLDSAVSGFGSVDLQAFGSRVARSGSSSSDVVSVTETAEETSVEVDPALPLKIFLSFGGVMLLAFIVLKRYGGL